MDTKKKKKELWNIMGTRRCRQRPKCKTKAYKRVPRNGNNFLLYYSECGSVFVLGPLSLHHNHNGTMAATQYRHTHTHNCTCMWRILMFISFQSDNKSQFIQVRQKPNNFFSPSLFLKSSGRPVEYHIGQEIMWTEWWTLVSAQKYKRFGVRWQKREQQQSWKRHREDNG